MERATDFVHQLDARQRAMLKAMGITVWAPTPEKASSTTVAENPSPVAVTPAPAAAPVASTPAARPSRVAATAPPAPAPVVVVPSVQRPAIDSSALASMDADALAKTIAACQACALCEGRRHAVAGGGHLPADWMVVGDALGDAEDEQGQVFVGDEGLLLDNMLRAVGRSRHEAGPSAAYVTTALKCRPLIGQKPADADIAQCANYLKRQVALVQPRVIVLMGSLATQAVLGSTEPLGRLRGQVHRFEGVPVIVTYPLRNLMGMPQNKAKAWDDLCLALAQLSTTA
ncbi:MAG: uracil-DNA glycosylase [Hydrogenophaga sp.]